MGGRLTAANIYRLLFIFFTLTPNYLMSVAFVLKHPTRYSTTSLALTGGYHITLNRIRPFFTVFFIYPSFYINLHNQPYWLCDFFLLITSPNHFNLFSLISSTHPPKHSCLRRNIQSPSYFSAHYTSKSPNNT